MQRAHVDGVRIRGMTAIQRWFLYIDGGGSEEFLDYKPGVDTPVPSQELWCRNGDVEQLELLLKRYLDDLATSRQSRDRAKADLAIADAKIKSLEAEIIERSALRPVLDIIHMELNTAKIHGYSEEHLDAILADCPDGECVKCAYIICPHKDGMHFHHDGCPSCGAHDEQITGT